MANLNPSDAARTVDAYSPAEVTEKVLGLAVSKTELSLGRQLPLTFLAGIYIGIGCIFSALFFGETALPYAVQRFAGGAVFSVGLLLVLVAGAELFTGNTMIAAGALEGRIGWSAALGNWVRVWLGNLLGALTLVALVYFSHVAETSNLARGLLATAAAKTSAGWGAIFVKGILCNLLVCLGVWMGYAARSVVDKAFAVLLPVAAFVALGFEHCVANMFFLPLGWLLVQAGVSVDGIAVETINLAGILKNLSAATLGNIVAGASLALVYRAAYGKKR